MTNTNTNNSTSLNKKAEQMEAMHKLTLLQSYMTEKYMQIDIAVANFLNPKIYSVDNIKLRKSIYNEVQFAFATYNLILNRVKELISNNHGSTVNYIATFHENDEINSYQYIFDNMTECVQNNITPLELAKAYQYNYHLGMSLGEFITSVDNNFVL